MSIASEIERLQTAKADLKTAIESKGVEVSDTDTIDTYASKVDEIQSGEGDSWYDTFWDSFQDYGRQDSYVFNGKHWNDITFKPKYDIVPTDVNSSLSFLHCRITNLKQILIDCDVVLDTSKMSGYVANTFKSPNITHIPALSVRFIMRNTFENCTNLISIDKIIMMDERAGFTDTTFKNCSSLTDVVIEGVIGGCNVLVQYSPITLESAVSFINALENYAGTDNEFTYTITFSPTTWGYLEAEGNASPNGNTWREYINDLGWNAS